MAPLRWPVPAGPRIGLRAAAIRLVGAHERKLAAGGRGVKMVSEFVKRHTVLNRNRTNEPTVRRVLELAEPEWAARAVEGGDRIVDSLEFYEQWTLRAFSASRARMKWAREGWLRAKLRQAGLGAGGRAGATEAAGATPDSRYRREAEEQAREWGMPLPPVAGGAESPPATLSGVTPLLAFGTHSSRGDEARALAHPALGRGPKRGAGLRRNRCGSVAWSREPIRDGSISRSGVRFDFRGVYEHDSAGARPTRPLKRRVIRGPRRPRRPRREPARRGPKTERRPSARAIRECPSAGWVRPA